MDFDWKKQKDFREKVKNYLKTYSVRPITDNLSYSMPYEEFKVKGLKFPAQRCICLKNFIKEVSLDFFIIKDSSKTTIGKFLLNEIKKMNSSVKEICYGIVDLELIDLLSSFKVCKINSTIYGRNDNIVPVLIYRTKYNETLNVKHFSQLIDDSSLRDKKHDEEYNFRCRLINGENHCSWVKLTDKLKHEEEFYESLFSGEIGDFIFENYSDVISVNPLGFNDVLLFDDTRTHLDREFIELCRDGRYYPFYELVYANRTTKILSLTDIKQNNRDHLIRVKNKINTQLAYEKRVLSRNCSSNVLYTKMNLKTVSKLLNETKDDVLMKVHSDILDNFIKGKNYIENKKDGILTDKDARDEWTASIGLKMKSIFEVLGIGEDVDENGCVEVVIKFTGSGYTEEFEELLFNEVDKMELFPIVERDVREFTVNEPSSKKTKFKKIKHECRYIRNFILMYSSEVEKKIPKILLK